ncbi:MAG TPA: hypothetical protein VHH33_00970 [Nitrososphaeraceae archaeon]|nr:hypothetical protein [Nitrososphaeraceae archaeon]
MKYTNNDLKVISDIVHLAHSDPEFRIEFFKNPKKILDQFNVSDNAKMLILSFFNEMKN